MQPQTSVGVDNDMRRYFFGPAASTQWSVERLKTECPRYSHLDADIRDQAEMARLFRDHPQAIANTLAIVKACRFSLEELKYEYPEEPIPQHRHLVRRDGRVLFYSLDDDHVAHILSVASDHVAETPELAGIEVTG